MLNNAFKTLSPSRWLRALLSKDAMTKAIVSWSGGKDCCLALYRFLQDPDFEVVGLLSTVCHIEGSDYIGMHMIECDLIRQQADALGLPLDIIEYRTEKSYRYYLKKLLKRYQQNDIKSIVFGDIHLEEIRRYREKNLQSFGISAIFPLWQKNPKDLLSEFIQAGFKAKIININKQFFTEDYLGTDISLEALQAIKGIDLAGENGEYHTLVYDGPIFRSPIAFALSFKHYLDNEKNFVVLRSKSKPL